MTTLIIGAGLIGSQIARILTEQGGMPLLMDRRHQPEALAEIVDLARVTVIEGDVLRPFDLTKALRDHDITGIIHTAANPMLTLGAQRDPYTAVELNIMGTMNVFEAARIHGIKRVVIASSNVLNHFIAGGEGQGNAAKEEAFPRPTTFYATTKQAVENLGLNYARWYGMEFAAMRYGAVFGPWSGHGGGGPSNVVREAVRRALAGEEVMLPSARIEWVYSKDAAPEQSSPCRRKACQAAYSTSPWASCPRPRIWRQRSARCFRAPKSGSRPPPPQPWHCPT